MKYIPKVPGLYILTHEPTGYYYAGSSRNVSKRVGQHKSDLENSRHVNPKLRDCYTTWDDMDIQIYPKDTYEEALAAEQDFLNKFATFRLCCNVSTNAKGWYIKDTMPIDLRAGISSRMKARFEDTEERLRLSQALSGRTRTDETKTKMALSASTSEKVKARHQRLRERVCIKVSIEGTVYDSITAASNALDVNRVTIHSRLGSRNFPTWFRLE